LLNCLRFLLVSMLLSALPVSAHAVWPAKPIHWVVPFAAGGPADNLARMLGAKMAQQDHHERVNFSGRAVVGVQRGRLARWLSEENSPFALSLSKGLAAWFDKLTTNGQEDCSTGSPRTAL
jgi:hypothetical protein